MEYRLPGVTLYRHSHLLQQKLSWYSVHNDKLSSYNHILNCC